MRDISASKDLVVRRVHSGDQNDICDHFLRLDVGSRRSRFFGAVSDAGVLKYARNVIRYDSVAGGAFVGGQLRGLVELSGLFHSWPSTAEAAFSVETDWQNIGIGDALFEQMFAMAQNRRVRTVQMTCLKENSHMRHLAAKHNARLFFDADAVEAVLYPNSPTPGSIAKEMIAQTREYSHVLFRQACKNRLPKDSQ